jgi:hypothetical protein
MTHTLDQQLAEIDRELTMRRRLYPEWVASGRMRGQTADSQMSAMAAVRETIRQLRQNETMTSKLTGKPIT